MTVQICEYVFDNIKIILVLLGKLEFIIILLLIQAGHRPLRNVCGVGVNFVPS